METIQLPELKCYCCKSIYHSDDKFCGSCGYPIQGTPEEQKQFSINYTSQKYEKDIVKDQIRNARIVLFVIAAFTLIYTIIAYFQDSDKVIFTINLILTLIYIGLGFWAKKKAFAAIFTGGLIYISIILLSAVIEPMTIFQGILFKIIFIIALTRAAYGAYKYKV